MPGDIRFQRKLVQQRFAEGVDRLDLQATRRFQRLGKEPPCGRKRRAIRLPLFDGRNPLGKFEVIQRRPFRQPLEDAVRHFGRRSLGIGEAENGRGAGAGEQKPDHPLRQHMRLAGAGIGRHPGRLAGMRSARLGKRGPAEPDGGIAAGR